MASYHAKPSQHRQRGCEGTSGRTPRGSILIAKWKERKIEYLQTASRCLSYSLVPSRNQENFLLGINLGVCPSRVYYFCALREREEETGAVQFTQRVAFIIKGPGFKSWLIPAPCGTHESAFLGLSAPRGGEQDGSTGLQRKHGGRVCREGSADSRVLTYSW